MRKVADYLRTHPIVAAAIAIGIVGGLFLYLTTPQPAPQPVMTPMPRVAVSPTPAPAAPDAAPSPAPPRPVAAPVDAGRPDPFSPLVRAEAGRPGLPAAPPPAPLPPPLFPGQIQPGQVPTPSPTPPPKDASTAELMGIVGDSGSVAIVKVGDQTHIVGRGDMILNKIRVIVIDITKRLVILEEDGERFELKMGGVSTRHAAATTRLGVI